jgi:hypothetical protein
VWFPHAGVLVWGDAPNKRCLGGGGGGAPPPHGEREGQSRLAK